MAYGPASRNDTNEQSKSNSGGRRSDDEAGRKYGPFVSFFGFLHESTSRHMLVFGGSLTLGSLVLVQQFYALVSGWSRWSSLTALTVAGSTALSAFGLSYYVARDDTSCTDCGKPFSLERVGKRPVSRSGNSDGGNRTYVEEIYECENCGTLTTELHSNMDREYTRS